MTQSVKSRLGNQSADLEQTIREVGDLFVDEIIGDVRAARELTEWLVGPPLRPADILRVLIFTDDY